MEKFKPLRLLYTLLAMVKSVTQVNLFLQELLPRGQHPNPLRDRNVSVNELVRRKVQGRPRVQTVSICFLYYL